LKIGIVTISYNQARFVDEAILSVQSQDGPFEREHVIVDAGSTDESRDIILARKDEHTKLIFEPDKGPADGLNRGFQDCKADIYSYLNSDDRYVPGAFAYVSEFFERNPEIDVLLGACRIIDERGKARWRKALSTPFSIKRFLYGITLTIQPATFFRRSTWEKTTGFNIDNRTCWDCELIIDMALTKANFATVSDVLADFRIYPESFTGSGQQSLSPFKLDQERITQKLCKEGYRRPPMLARFLARSACRLNPIRRAQELCLH
jgi:glycosyltransferase involved in cell wall biosynthesis